ncbi:MAG TPA: hypothetical protein VMM16_15670 [Verrucomicrobiae bacterium]|nr:hypothetical protein [Verrucomicrobiae bacterium]
MLHFCEWLEKNPWIVAIDSSVVVSLILEILHYSGFFVLVGATAIVDLRVMGLAARRRSSGEVASQLRPWMWTGLCMAVFSGFLMFAGDAVDFYGAITFRIKILVVLVAFIVGLVVFRLVPRWNELPSAPVAGKFIAFLSLVLWIGAILISVEVPAISGVG